MTDTTIRKSVFLATTKETVWAHLTDATLLGKWFHPADSDLEEGKPFTLVSQKDGDRMCWGSVEQASPHNYLKWAFTVGPLNGVMTTVEWTLESIAGGTRLSLVHAGVPEGGDSFGLLNALDKGWPGFLLNLHNLES
jgi:uncharacterized protein YndB with AHSA1/START domain